MLDEATHVLAADERNVLAELLLEQFDQPAAMIAFLRRHFAEHLGAGGVVLAQTFGDVGVDAAVLFLIGYRQSEDFRVR